MNVTEAVSVFKETKPRLDAVKEDEKRNKQAREVIAAHMHAKGITEYRGIRMREVAFSCWDDAKLRTFLGAKAGDYRGKSIRRFFDLVKPARS